MSVDYHRCYKVLQLDPGASWEELRKQYKHLVQHCHPDRFQGDATALGEVEANLRKLNAAYKALADYYKRNKHLPLDSVSKHTGWDFQDTSDLKRKGEQLQPARQWPVLKLPVSKWLVLAIPVLLVILVFSLLAFQSADEEESTPPALAGEAVKADTGKSGSTEKKPQSLFGYGDTWMTVLQVQGEPTSRKGDSWFYGKSRVDFKEGHVTGWVQKEGRPLHVHGKLPGESHAGKIRLIRLGDTKQKVLKLQGPPLMKSDRRWGYGPSFIEFRNGKVIRWHSSVLRPLAVDRPDARKD
ncbi:J domain-containing protein [Thiolapillus brandeum]|uniref:J domain-containing protein n=1 Tax=Thiolapillus brandeum TaxID=1076588 RepID=A0A7U6JJB2_9GAMM|nr:J domain-containing protein [Thiolapillus brandeum]BAO45428.1 hypothetical protein TBH_C2520 [Thiolapillus brandeum]